ncbi:MAG TPA: exopolysaccharide biosynthesis polyprenyl glycosylphosphotransferase [Candidatus Paceibacterota bacterium]
MLQHRRLVLLSGDISALALSLVLMVSIRFDRTSEMATILLQRELFAMLFIVWLIVFFIFDLYNIRRVNPNPRNIGLLVSAMVINVLLGLAFFYLSPQQSISPKTNLALVGVFAFLLLFAWRRLFYHLFTVRFTRNIAIIGTSPVITDLIAELARHRQLGTVLYHWESIPESAPSERIDILITEHIDPQNLLAFSRALGAEVMSLSDAYETLFGKIPLELMTEEKAVHYMSQSTNAGLHFVYRVFEIAFAVVVLIVMLPFMIVAVIARLIEDGTPIFFNHTRVGKDGKLFTVYKLRSMSKDAEKNGAQWATHKDTRITRLGRILRKTHIDEVPQMWNIIRGDIALVGPRPERPEFVSSLETTVPYYFLRHSIRPGFTGWAQIKYRYARTVDDSSEKFEYDLYYIKNKHPLLDIGIVLKTLQIIFTH